MNQFKKPLYKALTAHIYNDPISFHVPGHKFGRVFPKIEGAFFEKILKIDATELSGLDDLHSPEGPILEAESLLANLYSVKNSFFLINGSTAGNLVMVMSVCEEDDIVLVQRNCHKSILNALKLAKVEPVFLEPDYDKDWKIAVGVDIQTVKEAITAYPKAKALILTYPNYYGIAYELKEMIELAHQRHIPVLVDEAHGAHFILGDPFPPSAVKLGADLVVQSAHKTLPAMTMGSYLHYNSDLIDVQIVMEYLHIFQSSSPSYPIMASLDLARYYLATYESSDIALLEKEIQSFKEGLADIPSIRVLPYSGTGDLLKVTIQSTCGHSGLSLQKRLEAVGIFTELADPYNILFVLPLVKETQIYPLKEALAKIKAAFAGISSTRMMEIIPRKNKQISSLTVGYKEMKNFEVIDISLSEAAGMVAAEMIIPYPPGIPLLLQGEKITQDRLEGLIRLINDQAKFQGGSSLKQNKIKVFDTKEK
ncbi:aminotransferase class I/II-fold pyridoxal phosphate-dependent enzyme [Bacillus sp. EB600]|uniref:aminotransferase class I/II-fold pyridoxal phosphate-dependent enzyme n=1 Tax=Bacillus sp. EB600 TaxID=2806345 RepID=UPI00210E4BF9|nr:aminotransferase class I/II-fold pyridoxal phosphate-dependent enzyme [Bacillus sp. EB600]MCQ6281846.1 aminotransferase class I/II-fold pyridoxal phosphate-dependent enzyme [Bacillus sp. EB600]